jgi:hypothetical protein
MNKILELLFVLMAGGMAAGTQASEIVLIQPIVPYEKADTANDDVRKECDWNNTLPSYLAKESDGGVKILEQGIEAMPDKKLLLVATELHTAGGGGWSGPKWLVLEGKLVEGGKLLGNFEARRQTIRGSMRGCNTLTSLSEDIADDILEWLKAPSKDAKLGDAK